MADAQTEAEWAKSKQIEAEQMKAVKALAKEKPDKANLAFLNPKETKVKGWSRDADVIMASVEKMGNRALILALCGMVLGIIGAVGGTVSNVNRLGFGGVMISDLPSAVGLLCMGLAVIMAIIVVVCEIYGKVKQKKRFDATLWSAIGAIVVVILYFVVQRFVV